MFLKEYRTDVHCAGRSLPVRGVSQTYFIMCFRSRLDDLLREIKNLPSRVDVKVISIAGVVNGRNGPGHTNPKKHVNCITSRYIPNTGVCMFVIDCGHFACKRI